MRRAPQKRLLGTATTIIAVLVGLHMILTLTFVILWRRGSQEFMDRVRQFNKRWLNPVILTVAGRRGSPYAIILHKGRRSGRMYATPVVTARVPDGFIIPLAYGRSVDWYRNIQAAKEGLLQWQGNTYAVSAPALIDASSAMRAFPLLWQLSLRLYGINQFVKVTQVQERLGRPARIERPRVEVGV